MSEKKKPVLTPEVLIDHDLEDYYIQVELPGVKKEDIELTVTEQGFCVRGSRDDSDLVGCWYLAHLVNSDKAKAKYVDGLLNIMIPIQKPLKGKKIPIG